MNSTMKHALTLLTLCALALGTLSGCSAPDLPEEQIVQRIAALETALEEKDTQDALALIHANFGTPQGQDKHWVKRTLAYYAIKHNRIEIVTSGMNVELAPDAATAQFSALITGGEGLIPEQGAVYHVETHWRLEEGDWQLVFAQWQRP